MKSLQKSIKLTTLGFTLVELLVTMSIFVLVLAGAGASFRQANLRRSVNDAAETLRQAIFEVRGLALAPSVDKPPGLPGYALVLTSDTTWEIREIEPYIESGPEPLAHLSFGTTLETGRLPGGITYRTEPAIEWIGFRIAPTGEILIGPNVDDDLFDGVVIQVSRADIGMTISLIFDDETGLVDRVSGS